MERIAILNMQNKDTASLKITDIYNQEGEAAGTSVHLKIKAL